MRYKRNKSKRQRPDQMETTLKDSIHNSRRKEQAILKDLIPKKLKPVKRRAVASDGLVLGRPRLDSAPGVAEVDPAAVMKRLVALKAGGGGERLSVSASLARASAVASLAAKRSLDWEAHRDAKPASADERRSATAMRKRLLRETNAAAAAASAAAKEAHRAQLAEAHSNEAVDDEVEAKPQPQSKHARFREKDKKRASKVSRSRGETLVGVPTTVALGRDRVVSGTPSSGIRTAKQTGRKGVAAKRGGKKKVSKYKRKKN